jgi:Ca2+/Na+ antiporter
MLNLFDLLSLLIGLSLFFIAFEHYRRHFIRREAALLIVAGAGAIALGIAPSIIDMVGRLIAVETRPNIITALVNIFLVFGFVYLLLEVRQTKEEMISQIKSITKQQADSKDTAAGAADGKSIFVVIPAYNEEDSIGDVIRSLPDRIGAYLVTPLVVSDGSTDDTPDAADIEGTIIVDHPVNKGQGMALQTGFELACEHGADIVVTMDADGQHSASEISDLVDPIIRDQADFVVGSRYLGQDESRISATRQTGIWFFSALISLLIKTKITDCTNGFRALRTSCLSEMTLTAGRYNAPELLIEARKRGFRIQEVPVTIYRRQAGETKKPKLKYGAGLFRVVITTWIK